MNLSLLFLLIPSANSPTPLISLSKGFLGVNPTFPPCQATRCTIRSLWYPIPDSWIVFGRTGFSDLFDDTGAYSFLSKQWCLITCTGAFPSPRTHHLATLVCNKIFIYGGHDIHIAHIKDIYVLDLEFMYPSIASRPCSTESC